jgi:hypothetical protein
MRRIRIEFDGAHVTAELLDTPTADAIWEALPVDSTASVWGDEVYFDCGVSVGEEGDARVLVSAGEIAYWPPGDAIAIGFGPTPISKGDEIRLASPANVWAKSLNDVTSLKVVRAGSTVRVKRAE